MNIKKYLSLSYWFTKKSEVNSLGFPVDQPSNWSEIAGILQAKQAEILEKVSSPFIGVSNCNISIDTNVGYGCNSIFELSKLQNKAMLDDLQGLDFRDYWIQILINLDGTKDYFVKKGFRIAMFPNSVTPWKVEVFGGDFLARMREFETFEDTVEFITKSIPRILQEPQVGD